MDSALAERLIFNLVTILIPLILAIAVHEYAHVAMARWLGDRTGEAEGRLTLNPLVHIDPIWTVLIPAYFVYAQTMVGNLFAVPFFGAGKPAPYRPLNLTRPLFGKRITMRTGSLLVALAGPMSNVVLFAISAVIMVLLVKVGGFPLDDPRSPAVLLFRFALLNTGLAMFNMIPIPPLDGSKVLAGLLPRQMADRYEEVAAKLSWVLLIVLFLGGARFILGPIQNAAADLLWWLAHV
jgi:Zn-dependent protease